MAILIILIILLVVGFFLISRSKKGHGQVNPIEFFSAGKKAGFSFKEIEILRHLAGECELEYPNSVFTSQTGLDPCIRLMAKNIQSLGESEERGTQAFLSKLYEFRKQIEMNKPSIKIGISNSRQLSENIPLKILFEGAGVFTSQLLKQQVQHMIISRPSNSKIITPVKWNGAKISVYLWKDDDAGYVFDSSVIDEILSSGFPALKINHSEDLFRTQKRNSIRLKLHKAAFLYLVPKNEAPQKYENNPGLTCFIEDLSDTGFSVTVTGKAKSGARMKVQFVLENVPTCITGIIRNVTFNEKTGRSTLHFESEPLPTEINNFILGQVFSSPDDNDPEEDLPFRVLDNEVEKMSGQNSFSRKSPTNFDDLDV